MRGIGLPYGLHLSGRMVPVTEVPSGLECQCFCPSCGCRLVAKKGTQIIHHFAHEADADCARAYETMLHKLGKQVILDAGGLRIPPLVVQYLEFEKQVRPASWVAFDHLEKEVRWPGFQPDIVAQCSGRKIAVEIRVTHACGPEKIDIVRASGLAMIEIDLSHLPRIVSDSRARRAILSEAPRVWLFNPRLEKYHAAFVEEISARLEREREEALYAAALEGMHERQMAATKAALELARRLRNLGVADYRHDPEEAPDEGYKDIVVDGVTMSSRCNKIAEVELMARVFYRLSTPNRWLMETFWCDSKAGSCYIVWVRPGYDERGITAALGREIHQQLMALSSGHNGISVGETTVVGPDWGEFDSIGS